MKGTKTEVAPGVWRLRVYIGRNGRGNPVQRSKTIRTGDKNAKPGSGTRLADRELANMIAGGAKTALAELQMSMSLPSVIAGLVAKPVIAVPTSVGYGASFGGVAALLAMLNSCASGVTVVNIDNGFGAGYAASQINALAEK